jgi:DNA-directed RNA polymerase subunit RPC12/RpoP
MSGDNFCSKCKIEMKLLREEIISGTKYKILKCEKCNHQIARAET